MANLRSVFRTYYRLTKPGIIYGNAITAVAGFLLAARGHFQPGLLLAMLAGLSLIIASACVFNNYLDRGLDRKMNRTKRRALAQGTISGRSALIYATVLGLIGAAVLARFTNALALSIALGGLFAYVVLYGVGKRRTVHGTVIGSISGAVPPVVGYVAVTNRLDLGALLLFLILVCWQMPHFYAIAMYRYQDYAAGGLPVLPVVKGMQSAKRQIFGYIIAFIAAVVLLAICGFAGAIYLVTACTLGLIWLGLGLHGLTTHDDKHWARSMFLCSLIVVTGLCVAISLDSFLK